MYFQSVSLKLKKKIFIVVDEIAMCSSWIHGMTQPPQQSDTTTWPSFSQWNITWSDLHYLHSLELSKTSDTYSVLMEVFLFANTEQRVNSNPDFPLLKTGFAQSNRSWPICLSLLVLILITGALYWGTNVRVPFYNNFSVTDPQSATQFRASGSRVSLAS